MSHRKTFIIETQTITENEVLSACTKLFTNSIVSCISGGTITVNDTLSGSTFIVDDLYVSGSTINDIINQSSGSNLDLNNNTLSLLNASSNVLDSVDLTINNISGLTTALSSKVASVSGDGVDNTNPINPIIRFPSKNEISLGNVDNTSDINKPISNQTQLALDGKENSFIKNSAFNKNFGVSANTISEGNHVHVKSDITDFNDGDYATFTQGSKADTAFSWGNHNNANYSIISQTGTKLSGSSNNATISILTQDDQVLDTISLAYLNNEGTTLFYNDVTENIEIKNDDGDVLSSIPVSDFVTNIPTNLNLSSNTLQLRDATNNILSSVSFSISNINNLQSELDSKLNSVSGGTGITIDYTNPNIPLINSTAENNYISNVNLNGNLLQFTGQGNGFNNNINLTSLNTPAGNDGEIQFNNENVYGSSPNLIWDGVNNRLGIGRSNPNAKLHVGENGNSTLSSTALAVFKTTSSSPTGIVMGNADTGNGSDFRFIVEDTTGHYLSFNMPSINNTQSDLFGVSRSDGVFLFNSGGTSRDIGIGTLQDKALILGTNNENRLHIDSDGNIGVGTNLPNKKLHVNEGNVLITNPNEAVLTFDNPNDNNALSIFVRGSNNVISFNKRLEFREASYANAASGTNSSGNQLLFLRDSKVGINTSPTTEKLEVDGNILATSYITEGATSLQFVKGDGSLDSNIYLTSGDTESIINQNIESGIDERFIYGTRLTETIGTTYNIDWEEGSVFILTMSGDTTFNDINLPDGLRTKIITIELNGDFTPTFPINWEARPSNDIYDGTVRNEITINCKNGNTGEENITYSLENLST